MEIKKVVVIGSGTMGSGIAAHLCNANIPVTLLDLETEISEKARERIHKSKPPLLIDRSKINSDNALKNEKGGLSGKPLYDRSNDVIKFISKKSKNKFPIIGVGGIHSPKDAINKIKAGATLVQIYTGFIYEGPSLIKKINREIINQNN